MAKEAGNANVHGKGEEEGEGEDDATSREKACLVARDEVAHSEGGGNQVPSQQKNKKAGI